MILSQTANTTANDSSLSLLPSSWNIYSPFMKMATSTIQGRSRTAVYFLPEFTEHPKPQRRKTLQQRHLDPPSLPPPKQPPRDHTNILDEEQEVSFFQDFVAGGTAGCASIVVGHPFDTIKVRIQSASTTTVFNGSSGGGGRAGSMLTWMREFGGITSLFRGMGAPLSAATFINAIVFSSYGASSKLWDQYIASDMEDDDNDYDSNDTTPPLNHDPWPKSMTCGGFAGLVQCFIVCPMENVKCRVQVAGKWDARIGPMQILKTIVKEHGILRLYQGWWSTFWREVPAFGLYFASYDAIKDKVNTFFSRQAAAQRHTNNNNSNEYLADDPMGMQHSHTWLASAIAGGCAGCVTWAAVYPIDMIKTRIQTAPLTTPNEDLQIIKIATKLVRQHGWRYLFRGFGVTLVRAFPVNGTIFPVYEFTLLHLQQWQME